MDCRDGWACNGIAKRFLLPMGDVLHVYHDENTNPGRRVHVQFRCSNNHDFRMILQRINEANCIITFVQFILQTSTLTVYYNDPHGKETP